MYALRSAPETFSAAKNPLYGFAIDEFVEQMLRIHFAPAELHRAFGLTLEDLFCLIAKVQLQVHPVGFQRGTLWCCACRSMLRLRWRAEKVVQQATAEQRFERRDLALMPGKLRVVVVANLYLSAFSVLKHRYANRRLPHPA
jgi:hypothetical protein